ncbi:MULTISPECIES: hypothetical protein [unclassified Pseudomonas]|uniref:hypothetical protein n=1 Tax=unclassified Pseudomonas TaxID=196821 RepID=UPI001F5B9254|nr:MULTISPECIES: hypothetical protein [unclassified Pseudomonas]
MDIRTRSASSRKGSPNKGRPAVVHRDKKDPHAALRAPIRAPRYTAPRRLTTQQLKNPLLRMAFSRLSQIGELRGQYLRDLDTIHGGRRTRSEKFDALAKASEQMLLRLDLATGVLGWLDIERGQFFLNTQCGVAEDSGMSAASLNRLMHSLELAGYVYRRIEKVQLEEKDEAGLNLVRTRVLVRFTEKFFADLGVRYLWYRAKKAAIKRRERDLREVSGLRAARQEKASLEAFRRQQSRSNWEKSEARKAAQLNRQAEILIPARGSPNGATPSLELDRSSGGLDESMARLLRNVQIKKDSPSK